MCCDNPVSSLEFPDMESAAFKTRSKQTAVAPTHGSVPNRIS